MAPSILSYKKYDSSDDEGVRVTGVVELLNAISSSEIRQNTYALALDISQDLSLAHISHIISSIAFFRRLHELYFACYIVPQTLHSSIEAWRNLNKVYIKVCGIPYTHVGRILSRTSARSVTIDDTSGQEHLSPQQAAIYFPLRWLSLTHLHLSVALNPDLLLIYNFYCPALTHLTFLNAYGISDCIPSLTNGDCDLLRAAVPSLMQLEIVEEPHEIGFFVELDIQQHFSMRWIQRLHSFRIKFTSVYNNRARVEEMFALPIVPMLRTIIWPNDPAEHFWSIGWKDGPRRR